MRDTLALVARTLYTLTPTGVTLGSAPQGRATALVLSHVVTDARGLDNIGPIADIERDRGARASFLVVTRTAGSGGTPELTGTQAATLQALAKGGFDVAAAGVAPETIARAPAGSGAEAYPGYAPSPTRGGTTLSGEARVSRHIVSALVRRTPTLFGPPQLVPATGVGDHLEDALAASGYAADLAVAASAVGGTLPYRPTATGTTGTERPLLRVPVGFDDAGPTRVDQRGGELDALVSHAVATGAPATVRISPSGGTTATFALQRLLAGVSAGRVDRRRDHVRTLLVGRATALTLDVAPGEDAFVVRLVGHGAVPPQTLVCRSAPRAPPSAGRPPPWCSRETVVALPFRGSATGSRSRSRPRRRSASARGAQPHWSSTRRELPTEMSAAIWVKIVFSWPVSGPRRSSWTGWRPSPQCLVGRDGGRLGARPVAVRLALSPPIE